MPIIEVVVKILLDVVFFIYLFTIPIYLPRSTSLPDTRYKPCATRPHKNPIKTLHLQRF